MQYQIKFGAIELLSKSMAPPPPSEPDPLQYAFNFTVGIKVADEKKTAMVSTDITIIDQKTKTEAAKFNTLMFFEFPEFEKVFTKIEGHTYDMPEDLEILLKSAGISTSRGIIYSEVRGTYLHNAVLPLINMPGLIKEARAKIIGKQKQVDKDDHH